MATKRNQRNRRQEISLCKIVLPMLAELIESGRISIRLGPLRDVKEWLRNYEAHETKKTVAIDAASVCMEGNAHQIDLGLDDYASQLTSAAPKWARS
jgi:hypothetical protein